jgi:expansin (peptidoglycan-binding protein)
VTQIGGRKFVLAMSTLVSTSWLVSVGHIADGVYSAVVIATVGAYITGNVVQRLKEGGS